MEWIKTTETLPEIEEPVIAYGFCEGEINGRSISKTVESGIYKGAYIDLPSDAYYLRLVDFTHWMPLPEPPKE